MTNRELQEELKKFPDDVPAFIVYGLECIKIKKIELGPNKEGKEILWIDGGWSEE